MSDIVERLLIAFHDERMTSGALHKEAADTIESLRQQLAESQAREEMLREALSDKNLYCSDSVCDFPSAYCCRHLQKKALSLPRDHTALDAVKKAAKIEALREAARRVDDCSGATLRRMAKELKESE